MQPHIFPFFFVACPLSAKPLQSLYVDTAVYVGSFSVGFQVASPEEHFCMQGFLRFVRRSPGTPGDVEEVLQPAAASMRGVMREVLGSLDVRGTWGIKLQWALPARFGGLPDIGSELEDPVSDSGAWGLGVNLELVSRALYHILVLMTKR